VEGLSTQYPIGIDSDLEESFNASQELPNLWENWESEWLNISDSENLNDTALVPEELEQIFLDDFNWDVEKWDLQEEYTKFQNYLLSLPDKGERIIGVMQWASWMDLWEYVYNNWFIINPETQDAFLQSFLSADEIQALRLTEKQEIDLEEQQVDLEEQQVDLEEGNLRQDTQRFLELFVENQWLLWDTLYTRLWNLIEWWEEDILEANRLVQEYFQWLQHNPEEFQRVAQSFYDAWESSYEEFKQVAIQYNPVLVSQFEHFDENVGTTISDLDSSLWQAQIIGGLWTEEFEQYGSIVEASWDGQVIRMDISDVPPTRTLSLEWSTFSLPTDVPIWNFYTPISEHWLEYEAVKSENAPKINALDTLNGLEVQDFLQSDDFAKESLENCIRIISQMIGLNSNISLSDLLWQELTSKEDLKTSLLPGWILLRRKELEDEINDKEKAYENALKEEIKNYHESLREQDEITKKALLICKNSGLDLCDIDYILAQLSWSIVPDIWTPFDKGNIHVWNLNLGQPLSQQWNEKAFAEYVYRFVNKITFWDPEWKVWEDGEQLGFDLSQVVNNPMWQFKTDTQVRKMFEDNNVLNKVTGSSNRELTISRLIK